ncbi:glycosyl transferase family 1 [Siminovitchia terrae]|uniref:glycosyltransferase n=1 Tax=Siminovitchia terrae TaxID=1914933 RepID=UPI001B1DDEA5|nr:glycosyltransferase [Siminovitchia terrae]GIN90693.1 glycosyl transferase family 1 [Siminovitchia terrae]
MIKKTPVFIFNSLDVVRGGLTKAVLTRANTLINFCDEVIFLTLKFQPEFNSIKKKLYQSGLLDKRVKVVNFFDEYKNSIKEKIKLKQKNDQKTKESDYVVFEDQANELPSYRYYLNGVYKKYKRFDKNNNLMFIDYMNESRHRYRRDEYNRSGVLVRSRHMDLFTNKPKLDQYFNDKGVCYLSIWLNESGKENRTLLFGKNPQEYATLFEAYTNWIEEIISDLSNPLVMSDSRFTDSITLDINNDQAKKVAILHNNHFQEPFDSTAKIKKSWKPLYNNLDKYDSVVFLTEEQKKDFIELFGDFKSYAVIPHAAKTVKINKKTDYNPYLAVTLARYDSQKRLDEAINAFYYVVQELPEAQYHIYGFGPLENDLRGIITDLNLEENVKLKGFSHDPAKIYQSAACSILTSDYEGFGMVLTESLAAGTPVVSYDIKYGPKDIIQDGIDGYLIPKGDTKKMASRIIEIMKNPGLREELSNNSRDVINRFSEERYTESWLSLLKNI